MRTTSAFWFSIRVFCALDGGVVAGVELLLELRRQGPCPVELGFVEQRLALGGEVLDAALEPRTDFCASSNAKVRARWWLASLG